MAFNPFAGMPGYDQYPGYKPYTGPEMPGQTPNWVDTPPDEPALIAQQNAIRAAQQPNNDWRAQQIEAALKALGYTPTVTPTTQQSSWLNPQTSYTVALKEIPGYEYAIPYGQGQFDPAGRAKYVASEGQRQQTGMYAPPAAAPAATPQTAAAVPPGGRTRPVLPANPPVATQQRQFVSGDLLRALPSRRMGSSALLRWRR